MKRAVAVIALLVVGATMTFAQTKIRGIEHPDRIPDAVAYRVWLDGVSGMDEQYREGAIKAIGLTKADHDVLVVELDRYLVLRESLRITYNKHQMETEGKDVGSIMKYREDVAALVTQTRKNFESSASAYAPPLLYAHIQREKAGMTISESEAK